jgi:CheY-like chemotaxis protein
MSRILIVDDDPGLRQLYQKVLSRQGYDVRLAANGADALLALEMSMPDLVMLDLAMPDMDGIALLRVIRRTPGWEKIPVIVLTAFTDSTRLAPLAELNVAHQLTKAEFSVRELRAKIAECLGLPAAAAAA